MVQRVPPEMESFVRQRVCTHVDQANQFYQRRMPVPRLDFSLRGSTAGQMVAQRVTARRSNYTLRFNGALLVAHPDYFMADVLPHEVAHMVVDWIHGRRVKPHGLEWQRVMLECFHASPQRCHDLPVAPARRHRRDYLYRCGCQTHEFTARRHRNAVNGSRYVCRSCGDSLVYQCQRHELLEAQLPTV